MKEVKVVIGANYGDEGKGLMTNYFARQADKKHKKCLNILFNGGAQRGHTVENGDFRHVFMLLVQRHIKMRIPFTIIISWLILLFFFLRKRN